MFKNILNTFGTRALTAVVNLLIAIILSQILGPAGKGQQGLIITTITFILVFSNLVGGATLVFLAPRKDHSQLLLPSYSWTILISLLAAPILLILKLVESNFIVHVCILAALNSFTAIHTSMLIGKEKIKRANLVALIQPMLIILSLVLFFLILKWESIWAYILSLYISFCISLIISYMFLIRIVGTIMIRSLEDYMRIMGEMFRYGIYNQIAHITQMLSFRMSYYVLNSYHGEGAVGIYSNGISLAESIWLIAKSISLVQYARISNTDDRNYSQRLTVQLSKASIALSLLILIPLIFLPSGVYSFIFGAGFGDVRTVIWALAAGVLIYNLSILLGHYFSGTGRYHINAIASSAGLVVSVLLFFLLIPDYGITGAGLATSISYLFTSIILLVFFVRDNPGNFLKSLSCKGEMAVIKKELKGIFRA
jgi:O-antigen/teichoic acid export membrane protein